MFGKYFQSSNSLQLANWLPAISHCNHKFSTVCFKYTTQLTLSFHIISQKWIQMMSRNYLLQQLSCYNRRLVLLGISPIGNNVKKKMLENFIRLINNLRFCSNPLNNALWRQRTPLKTLNKSTVWISDSQSIAIFSLFPADSTLNCIFFYFYLLHTFLFLALIIMSSLNMSWTSGVIEQDIIRERIIVSNLKKPKARI